MRIPYKTVGVPQWVSGAKLFGLHSFSVVVPNLLYRVELKFRYGRNKSRNFLANSLVSDSLSVVSIKIGLFL